MDRKAIVFGARSALGAATVRALVARDVSVDAARLWNEPALPDRPGVRDVVADLESDDLVPSLVGRNWVFVAAWPGEHDAPERFSARATDGLRNLAGAAREAGVDRLIVALPAGIAWKPGPDPCDESSRYLPGSAADARLDAYYAIAQTAAYIAADGLDCVVVASALLVGTGVEPIRVSVPRDHRSIDIVDVDEAARAHVSAAIQGGWGATYLLGGHSIKRSRLPNFVAAPRSTGLLGRGGSDIRAHLVEPGVRVIPARAQSELGFRPDFGL